MKILWWITVILTQQNFIIIIATELQNMINNLAAYETVIFTDGSMYQENFLEYFMNNKPSVIVDLNQFLNNTHEIQSFELSIFQNPRQSDVYIIITSILSRMSDILQKIIKIEPVKPRPRTVLFTSYRYSDEDLETIFIHAWSLKFLDFTIIKIDNIGDRVLLTFNPFTNKHTKEKLRDVSELFPDKLNNVNGYPLTTRAFNSPPFLFAEMKGNKIINIKGSRTTRIKIIAEKLNFKLTFIGNLLNTTEVVEKLSQNLESNEINMTPVGFRFNVILQKSNILLGYPESISQLTVIVPVIKTPRIDITLDMLILLFIFCIILIIFLTFACALKLSPDYWNVFHIFGILIGITIIEPPKRSDRIVYLTIAFLSIIFSNNYFSTLADLKLNFVEKKLNNLEDLYQSNIPIYSPNINYLFNDSKADKQLLSYTQKIGTNDECIELLIKTNNVACVVSSYNAGHYLKTILNPQGRAVMKILDVPLQNTFIAFIYEKASPFLEKIEKLVLNVFESSLRSTGDQLASSKVRTIRQKESFKEEILLKQIILIILSVGYTLATIIFVFEFLRSHACLKM